MVFLQFKGAVSYTCSWDPLFSKICEHYMPEFNSIGEFIVIVTAIHRIFIVSETNLKLIHRNELNLLPGSNTQKHQIENS